VCDCCDGSDEISTPFPIKCPGNCGRAVSLVHNHIRPSRLRTRDLSGTSAHFRLSSPIRLPPIHLVTSSGANSIESYASPAFGGVWYYMSVFLCCFFVCVCVVSAVLQIIFPKGKNNSHAGFHSRLSRCINGFFDFLWRPRKSADCTV
jgi:hypothetical protein